MTRKLFLALALVAGTGMNAFGQLQFGPQIGLSFNGSDLYIGGNAIFNLPWEAGDHTLQANPEVLIYFLEDSPGFSQSLTVVVLNALYPLELEFANAYVGGGLVIGMYKGEFSEGFLDNQVQRNFDDTDIGLNLKFGVDFGDEDAKFVPWGEAGFQLKDGGGLWVQGGGRFKL